MKITLLSENSTQQPAYAPEFGLSMFIECGSTKILFDSGSSGTFARNAKTLGVDLGAVDVAVLSHGHFDHSDGFPTFAQLNDHAPIYVHEGFDRKHVKKNGADIGIAPELSGLVEDGRIVVTAARRSIGDGLELLSYPDGELLHPVASGDMLEEEGGALHPDLFTHEHYLLACEGEKRLLVTGCSHRGIANIMHWTRDEGITHVVGGFHLMDMRPDEYDGLGGLADELLAYPVTYFTGHCTGIEQYSRLKGHMGTRVSYLSCGMSVEF